MTIDIREKLETYKVYNRLAGETNDLERYSRLSAESEKIAYEIAIAYEESIVAVDALMKVCAGIPHGESLLWREEQEVLKAMELGRKVLNHND